MKVGASLFEVSPSNNPESWIPVFKVATDWISGWDSFAVLLLVFTSVKDYIRRVNVYYDSVSKKMS